MESLLSIWNSHGKWYDLPHWFRTHESMKAEAENYAANLAELGEGARAFVARGHMGGLHLLWMEIYAERYDVIQGAGNDKNTPHPATWGKRSAEDYLKDYARRIDKHGRGVGLVALQYFAEYVAEVLTAFGVEWEQGEKHAEILSAPGDVVLPMELDTDPAREAFAQALARGWIAERGNGYEWRGVADKGRKSQLAYFCGRVYGYKWGFTNTTSGGNVGERVLWQALQALFSFHGDLQKIIRIVYGAKKPQPWRRIIDSIF